MSDERPTGEAIPPDPGTHEVRRLPVKKTKRKPSLTDIDTEFLHLTDRQIHEPQRVAVSARGMISTAHHSATAAGAKMLAEGGNVFDAAVAAAFALGVCEPAASGLGGQTMMLVHHAGTGRTFALDGSSRAPNRAVAESFKNLRAERRRGYRSATVPSTPATLDYTLSTYGTMDLAQVLEPACRLAEDGYEVSVLQYHLTRRERRFLRAGTAAEFFLRDGKRTYRAGVMLRQPVLSATLRRLAAQGIEDFYRGETARLIDADMARHDGLIRLDDLAQIPQPIERRPVTGRFGGHRVFTMPPPGAGRTLIEMMNIYQQLPESRRGLDTCEGAALFAEIVRRAFMDRADRPFDANFYTQVPEKQMLSEDYARKVARQVRRRFLGHGETTHLSAMDQAGNAIALTQSIENVYGSCSATPELGFLYNNYMNAFEYDDIGHPYHMRPNAAPWASVSPTIIFRGKRPWLAIGSPGSERVAPSILQVLIRLLDGEPPLSAVSAPRLFCSLAGKVSLEASRMRDDLPAALERHGFTVDVRDPFSFYLGCVQMVMRSKHEFVGVADPRRDGAASGPRVPDGARRPAIRDGAV